MPDDVPEPDGLWIHAMLEAGDIKQAYAIREAPVSFTLRTPANQVRMRVIAGYDPEREVVVHRLEEGDQLHEEIVDRESPHRFTVESENGHDQQFALWYHDDPYPGDLHDVTVPEERDDEAA